MMPLPAWLPVWSLVPPGGVSVLSPMFLPGGLCQGGSLSRGSLSRRVRVYVQGDFCGKTPQESEKRADASYWNAIHTFVHKLSHIPLMSASHSSFFSVIIQIWKFEQILHFYVSVTV